MASSSNTVVYLGDLAEKDLQGGRQVRREERGREINGSVTLHRELVDLLAAPLWTDQDTQSRWICFKVAAISFDLS